MFMARGRGVVENRKSPEPTWSRRAAAIPQCSGFSMSFHETIFQLMQKCISILTEISVLVLIMVLVCSYISLVTPQMPLLPFITVFWPNCDTMDTRCIMNLNLFMNNKSHFMHASNFTRFLGKIQSVSNTNLTRFSINSN